MVVSAADVLANHKATPQSGESKGKEGPAQCTTETRFSAPLKDISEDTDLHGREQPKSVSMSCFLLLMILVMTLFLH